MEKISEDCAVSVFGKVLYVSGKELLCGEMTVQGGKVFLSDSAPVVSETAVRDAKVIVPAFADVHVHLREPGFFYKESIATGTESAARGGYTAVCSMPNLNPVPDSVENLKKQLEIIKSSAKVLVRPFAALTVGEKGRELSDIEGLAPSVVGFSDDGKGVQSESLMLEAMKRVRAVGGIISAHCEDESLLRGGCIHDGAYARAHGYKGICSESEWKMVERDIALAEKTGVRYHVCHVSTKESVDIIRKAKARGVDVTCETAPHYLVLCEDDLKDEGRFKMNPPLRTAQDREALVEGLADGTVDMIATDHAPHSDEEKSRGLAGSLMGVIGLEYAFPVLYTELVLTGRIPFVRLVEAMSAAPRRRFGFPVAEIKDGATAELAVVDLSEEWTVRGADSASKGNATPFEGRKIKGKIITTMSGGEIIWRK